MRLQIISAVSVFATCTVASPTFHQPLRAYDASSHQVVIGPSRDSTPQFPSKPGHRPAGFIALGDSYSAGIGTGFEGAEDECRHGLHAYPALIQADMIEHEGANTTSFQFLSCTGSTTDNLLSGGATSQIDNLNTTINADFALLSVGGNDLGFFDIMNSCIFRFYSVYSGTCEAALRRSDEQLASPDFEHRLKLAIMEILDRVKWEKKPWFTIFMTGYARFFNVDTDECDESSFGVWWRGPKLKRELRQRMNRMVLEVNAKIERSIDSINSGFSEKKIFLVNYDAAFEGHRFCEPNVTEPDYARNETYFFLVGGPDNAGFNQSTPETMATTPVLAASSPLVDPDTCLPAAQRSGDWGELAVCMMARAARDDPSLRDRTGDFVAENSMWYVPTYYGKTFHPRSLGHKVIRDQIYKVWDELHPTPFRA